MTAFSPSGSQVPIRQAPALIDLGVDRPGGEAKRKNMKIYQLSYVHNEHGNVISWHGSYGSALATLKGAKLQAIEEEYTIDGESILSREVKPTKKDFVRFLNQWTPALDNG